MASVVVGRAQDANITAERLVQMHRLRFDVFHEKLGWDVDGTDGQERDDYDRINPYYMIADDAPASAHGAPAQGCWRLLPTQGPYMLRYTFPELLRGEVAPDSQAVWELSRFAVTSPSRRFGGQIYLSDLTYAMIAGLIDFADERNIRDFVTVTSVSVERLMLKCGIPMIRFGDGQSTRVGHVESVACWIPVNEQFRDAVRHADDELDLGLLKTA